MLRKATFRVSFGGDVILVRTAGTIFESLLIQGPELNLMTSFESDITNLCLLLAYVQVVILSGFCITTEQAKQIGAAGTRPFLCNCRIMACEPVNIPAIRLKVIVTQMSLTLGVPNIAVVAVMPSN